VRFRIRKAWLASALLAVCVSAPGPAPKAPDGLGPEGRKAFAWLGYEPKTREEAAEGYWMLRAMYPRSQVEYDDPRRTMKPPKTDGEALIRARYEALDVIYQDLYGRELPWPIHGLNAWYNPVHLKRTEVLVLTYEPRTMTRSFEATFPSEPKYFVPEDLDESSRGSVRVRRMQLSQHAFGDEIVVYDHPGLDSQLYEEMLYQNEKTLEEFVRRGVVPPAWAAQLRDREPSFERGDPNDIDARMRRERTIDWAYVDPRNQEPLYHFRIEDASRRVNRIAKDTWVFRPAGKTDPPLRLKLERDNPDFPIPERVKYGEDAELIEIQKLFRDPQVEDAVKAGFGIAARAIRELHGDKKGRLSEKVAVYGETTPRVAELYRDNYGFEILGDTGKGTQIFGMKAQKFYELYGKTPLPVYRPGANACFDAAVRRAIRSR
jgi:hypothetical protein